MIISDRFIFIDFWFGNFMISENSTNLKKTKLKKRGGSKNGKLIKK